MQMYGRKGNRRAGSLSGVAYKRAYCSSLCRIGIQGREMRSGRHGDSSIRHECSFSNYFVNTTIRTKFSIGLLNFVSMPNRKSYTVAGKIVYSAEHDLISHIGGSVARGESWTLTWKAYRMSIFEPRMSTRR